MSPLESFSSPKSSIYCIAMLRLSAMAGAVTTVRYENYKCKMCEKTKKNTFCDYTIAQNNTNMIHLRKNI
jgi:hypothetical protein